MRWPWLRAPQPPPEPPCESVGHKQSIVYGGNPRSVLRSEDGHRWIPVSENFIYCGRCKEWYSEAVPAKRLWKEQDPEPIERHFLL